MAIQQSNRRSDPDDDDEADAPVVAEINVTPLVDVMLVLLIIFMVTAPLMTANVPLHLPQSNAARQTVVQRPTVLSLDAEGHVFLGDVRIADGELPERLRSLAQQPDQQTVYVRADEALPYGTVMRVLGEMTSAGISRLSLVSVQKQPQQPDATK
jgi:biopolymer transport protein TolR